MAAVPYRALSIVAAIVIGACGAHASAEAVVVVSAKNPVTSLSRGQVTDIFLGRTLRFPDGQPAVPIDQFEGSSTRDEFYLAFAGKSQAQINAHWSRIIFTGRGQPPLEVANAAEVKKRLAHDPSAIGYIEPRMVDSSVKVVTAP